MPPAPRPIPLPGTFRVCVIRKKGRFVVDPPIAFLPPGGTLRVFNTTPEELDFVFWGPHAAPVTRLIAAKGSADHRPPGPVGQYRYRIWMRHSEKWARGNSDPMIIIDNP